MSAAAEEKLGTLKIADDVIAVCTMNATLKTKGVAGLSGVFADSISKNIYFPTLFRNRLHNQLPYTSLIPSHRSRIIATADRTDK